MFLIEGLVACLVGVIAMFHLPDGPRTAKWLNAEEKDVLATAIGAEESEKEEHAQRGMFKALVDWRVIYFCVVCFTIQVLGYGYNFYIPTQVSALLGRSVGLAVGLVTAIPAVFAVIGLALVPRWAERIDRRRQVAVAVYAMGAIGIALSGVLSGNPLLTIAALCLAYTGHIVVQPLFWTNVSTYLTSGAAASGIAVIGALGNLGGFVGTVVAANAGVVMFLPPLFFLVAAGLAFATGTSWGTFGILIPIAIAVLGQTAPDILVVSVAAILSGAVCGDHASPISDTTILASAGAQCHHLDHVSTQLPYVAVVASCSLIGYIADGLTENGYIGLAVGIVSLAVFMVVLSSRVTSAER